MLALSSALFSTHADALMTDQNPIKHDQDYMQNSFVHFPLPDQPNFEHRDSPVNDADLVKVKKLNHNATERNRRKKMNNLYSSLRSLLPANHQQKNLSNPATVSRVLKYIPELQQQLKELIQKKEELLCRIAKQREQNYATKQELGCTYERSLPAISSTQLNDTEILVQISTHKMHKSIMLSEILLSLEYDGLSLLNASSSQSSGNMIFYSLHFQVQKNDRLKDGTLSEKPRLSSGREINESFYLTIDNYIDG